MILVRTEFQAKPGQASSVVDFFKALANSDYDPQAVIKRNRILTDLSGTFDTVIVESEIESLDAYFALLQASFADPQLMEQMNAAGVLDYRTGSRTFYTVEASIEAGG
jgi:hypothetical protein